MSRRHDHGDPERLTARGLDALDDLPMFAPTSTEVGLAARDATAAKNARDIERLIPIARELAEKAGPSGVTVSDLRVTAVQRGILTGQEVGKSLSYLGAVLSRAGLEPTGTYRRSDIVRSHGNLHQTYILPDADRVSRAPECPASRHVVPDSAA